MNTPHDHTRPDQVDHPAALVPATADPPSIALYASDLAGHRAINELVRLMSVVKGVQQVTLDPGGRPIRILYDPALTDGDALVEHARVAGFGVCVVTTSFELYALRSRVCPGSVAAALRHLRGVLEVAVDRPAALLTVSYIPGPTTTARVCSALTTLVQNHGRTTRQRPSTHRRQSSFRAQHHHA